MPVIIPEISDDNSITLSFDRKNCLKFKLIQVLNNGSKSEVKLIKSSENDTFYGLFDVEDVDFEIFVDSRDNVYGIKFEIKLKNEMIGELFYIQKDWDEIKALKNNGKHLHFIDQSTDEGKALLALSAHNNRTTIKDESINCSRIEFTVQLESPFPVPKPLSVPVFKPKTGMRSEGVLGTLFVFIAENGKTIAISIGLNSRIEYLIEKIEESSGISFSEEDSLTFGTKHLDGNRLSDYGIKNGSRIYHTRRFKAGGRGILCFGHKTNVHFIPYSDFTALEEYEIKSFTIELRMKSKYSLNK